MAAQHNSLICPANLVLKCAWCETDKSCVTATCKSPGCHPCGDKCSSGDCRFLNCDINTTQLWTIVVPVVVGLLFVSCFVIYCMCCRGGVSRALAREDKKSAILADKRSARQETRHKERNQTREMYRNKYGITQSTDLNEELLGENNDDVTIWKNNDHAQ
eukprot:m.320517 g.320517  ORF g.320517 m.320517 type:complete len:160 (-) comp20322_c1_seq1:1516-1995(-)